MRGTARRLFDRGDHELLQLPVDAVAMLVLEHIVEQQTAGVQPNRWNVLNEAQNAGRHALVPVLSEALQWLESKVLIAPSGSSSERDWLLVTSRGLQVLNDGFAALQAGERLDIDLHPRIGQSVRRQFLIGEYELAVLKAMRAVEIRVRGLSGRPGIGRPLIQNAFGKQGNLRDVTADQGEQTALMELLSGAIGLFRNPPAHREVDFDDPTHAAEVIILARVTTYLTHLGVPYDRAHMVASSTKGI